MRSPPRIGAPLALLVCACLACRGHHEGDEPAPTLTGFAVYVDENDNGVADAGDSVLVTFSASVDLAGADASDFDLLVPGDAFGAGATVAPGAESNQVRIELGQNPSLRTRGTFGSGLGPNAPSGIDLSPPPVSGSIVHSLTGVPAERSGGVDLVPGFAASPAAAPAVPGVAASLLRDLDRDGDLDLVLGRVSGGNRVLLGDGNGAFADSGQSLGSTPTSALAAGDVDGDGDLDLVEGNDGGVGNRVWRGDGSGFFASDFQVIGSDSTRALALGDLDGDGDLDLATGNVGADRVHKNDGTGLFGASLQALGGLATEALALGDLDWDGDLDLVVANRGGQPNRAYLNDGAAFFFELPQVLGSGDTRALALGDLDRDGDLDLVLGNFAEPNLVLRNGATGIFDARALDGAEPTLALALGDTDADGDLDLFEGTADGRPTILSFNDGAGAFRRGLGIGSGDTVSLELGDVDRDGDLDLVAVDDDLGARVFTNSLGGTFGAVTLREILGPPDVLPTRGVALSDLDRDGALDLIVGVGESLPSRVFFGDGSGELAFGLDDTRAVLAADVDGDGDPDVVAANHGSPNRVFANDGFGFLLDTGQLLDAGSTTSAAAGDLDGNGTLDLVFGNRDQMPNTVFLGSSIEPGLFADSGQLLGQRSTFAVALGDLDGDGDLDLVSGNDGEDRVWRNDGFASFTDLLALPASSGTSTRALALGDLDRDGRLDVVTGVSNGPDRAWRNTSSQGAIAFASPVLLPGSLDTRALVLGDVDGDGDLDAAAGNFGQPGRLYLNDGAGSLATAVDLALVGQTTSLAAGDLDRDGDVDFAVGNLDQRDSLLVNE